MRKAVILISTLTAALISAGLAENGAWIASLGVMAYPLFVLWANTRKKKPRRAGRGKGNKHKKIPCRYSTTVTIGTQAKINTPTGKMIMPIHYEL